ncbi:MAG: prolipoprotein diacylglyceryl transferase [Holosporales bacterium]|jgi:phosphatidylglycerol:prolipoprotein diacylglycerol transferase|nr:prolipoprotein diacylglyceryl transferase [Holosporales bacterium]
MYLDPVAFRIFGFSVYWYALAYITGILLGLCCMLKVNVRLGAPFSSCTLESFVNWGIIGIIVGGRLGHIFYEPEVFLENPLHIFAIRQGGMSFHGGFLGVLIAAWGFSQKKHLCFWRFMDILAVATPIGLFLGRLANFINGELYGQPTSLPWGVIFPKGGAEARHPSQLYEAFFEGIVLWSILWYTTRTQGSALPPGRLAGIFALGYGLIRIVLEEVRAPDSAFNEAFFDILHVTLGQALSFPLLVLGLWLLLRKGACLRSKRR